MNLKSFIPAVFLILVFPTPPVSCINKKDKAATTNFTAHNLSAAEHLITKRNTDSIPQGKFKYRIYFAEFGGRLPNRTCIVEIKGDQICVLQDETTHLSGGRIIFKGYILKHKSGKWILAEKRSDINADEIGGCSGLPIIEFDKKLIEWC